MVESNELGGIFIKAGLCGILERKDYQSLEKVFPILGPVIYQSIEYEKTASMTGVRTNYELQ